VSNAAVAAPPAPGQACSSKPMTGQGDGDGVTFGATRPWAV